MVVVRSRFALGDTSGVSTSLANKIYMYVWILECVGDTSMSMWVSWETACPFSYRRFQSYCHACDHITVSRKAKTKIQMKIKGEWERQNLPLFTPLPMADGTLIIIWGFLFLSNGNARIHQVRDRHYLLSMVFNKSANKISKGLTRTGYEEGEKKCMHIYKEWGTRCKVQYIRHCILVIFSKNYPI